MHTFLKGKMLQSGRYLQHRTGNRDFQRFPNTGRGFGAGGSPVKNGQEKAYGGRQSFAAGSIS